MMLNKLKSKFKVEATLENIKIPYRETIKKSITQRTRFKKQSGGHGQFGEVEITFELPTITVNHIFLKKKYLAVQFLNLIFLQLRRD